MTRTPDGPGTVTRILDTAERLVQTRGYNGFSYADVSAELGVTKASLHYHFATKADLGRALILRYTATFASALSTIDSGRTDALTKLERYMTLYSDVLRGSRMCLCGMLAAEYTTLPKAMQGQIRHFFAANEVWLAAVVDQGRRDGAFHHRGSSQEAARALFGALEGAMLVARPYNDVARFISAARHVLADLQAQPQAAATVAERKGRVRPSRDRAPTA